MLLSFVIVFFQRRDPKTVWAWILVLYFSPIIGFALYMLIGQRMHKQNLFRKKEIEDELNAQIRKQKEIIVNQEYDISDERLLEYQEQVMFNLNSNGSIYTENNELEIFTDGKHLFEKLLEELKKAERFIHIQSYIVRSGELTDSIFQVLEEKAKKGVEVRLLYDSVGANGRLKKNDLKRLKEAGVKLGEFFPAILGRFQLRLNYRNHRKIVVIDGDKAFVGGFNIGDEYIDKNERFGHWRDTHFLIKGEAVNDLNHRFMLDWNYTAKENLLHKKEYFNNEPEILKEKLGIQIVSSGPDSKRQEIRDNYIKLINKAKKSIYIQTPYFIPDEPVAEALEIAALSGVDVRIMIPCKPDHPFVYWCTYSYAGDLLESGVKVYCYDEGFLHAKGIVVDDIVSSYGTANMDMRSFALNFEVNAIIYDPEVSQYLSDIFKKDIDSCSELTLYDYRKRNLWIRFREQLARLIAPLL